MLPYSTPPAINGLTQAANIKALDHLWGSPNDPQTPLTLSAQWIDTPLGIMLAIADARGLQLLDFVDRKNLPNRITALRLFHSACITHTPHPDHLPTLKKVKTALDQYFDADSGTRGAGTGAGGFLGHKGPPLNITLASLSSDSDATQFQRAVWNQLLQIPLGETRTYAQQAAAIDRPTATRAVALANSQNYIALLIPCHRVIGSDGSLTGYASGVWRKEWLLAHEVRLASKARELGMS